MIQLKYRPQDIGFVKKQAQAVRYSLNSISNIPPLTSRQMLDFWVQSLGYIDWQHFSRQTKGHCSSSQSPELINKNYFSLFANKLHQYILGVSLEQIKWALASLTMIEQDDVDLIKRLLIRTVPSLLTDQHKKLIECDCIALDTRVNQLNPDENIIVGYIPTEHGKYAAANQLEKSEGRALSTIELVTLGLPTQLCRLTTVRSEFILS